jgi:hypothetical protein
MKALTVALIAMVALAGCSTNRGRTTQMFPDCDDVRADQQRSTKCVHRPDAPDSMSH